MGDAIFTEKIRILYTKLFFCTICILIKNKYLQLLNFREKMNQKNTKNRKKIYIYLHCWYKDTVKIWVLLLHYLQFMDKMSMSSNQIDKRSLCMETAVNTE